MTQGLLLTAALAGAALTLAAADGRGGGGTAGLLAAMPDDLARYRSTNRPVLVFAPSAADPAYRAQRAALEAAADGLAERDVVVLVDVSPSVGGTLRRRFGAEGFEVLLVGKDGSVKLRQARPVTADTLFATIDAMPMRQREMER